MILLLVWLRTAHHRAVRAGCRGCQPRAPRTRRAQGEGRSGRASIPIPEALYTELLAYLLEHGKRGALFRTSILGRRITDKDVCEIVRATATRAGLRPGVTARTLRHSFATHLMDRGVDLAIIASLMGHRSPQETGVYLHVCRSGQKPQFAPCRSESAHEVVVLDRTLHSHALRRARLASSVSAAYEATLGSSATGSRDVRHDSRTDQVTAREVLEYLQYLRDERDNGASAVNRTVTILRQLLSRDRRDGPSRSHGQPVDRFSVDQGSAAQAAVFSGNRTGEPTDQRNPSTIP